MKKMFSVLLLVITLLIAQTASALAAAPQVSGQIGSPPSPNAYQMISRGECSLTDLGDGSLNISGLTQTFYAVDEVDLTLNLQYYSGGNWYTLNSYNYTRYNSSSVSGGQTLGVTKGYTYRIFAQHRALDGEIVENGQSYSPSITIY